jgi:hypothetical protein
MQKNRRMKANRTLIIPILLGITCIILSALYTSSYLAILGVSLIFWCGILLYITHSKQVPITFLIASTAANTSNIERLLTELKSKKKAIYLSPKNLEDAASALVFIPKTQKQTLPSTKETKTPLIFNEKKDGLFLTTSATALIKLYEQKLGKSFTKIPLKDLLKVLSKLLVEDFGIAENIEMQIQPSKITVEIKGSIFREDCHETQKYPLTHNSVGCLLSSSFAGILTKSSGKPVTIESEENLDLQTSRIIYQILEE